MRAHCCVINDGPAPLRSIAIVLVAILVTVEVEHLEQIPMAGLLRGTGYQNRISRMQHISDDDRYTALLISAHRLF
jgi:hypothetical protein